jgi:hypothetical protein
MLLTFAAMLLMAQPGDVIIEHATRVVRPAAAPAQVDTLQVRISSPEGLLWQGPVRVSRNQGASYQQNLSQAFADSCPPDSGYDRSERRHINFSIYSQQSQQGVQYRVDVSWARPIIDSSCGETGTRTVQINQTMFLNPGETQAMSGDAGLKVEISRR